VPPPLRPRGSPTKPPPRGARGRRRYWGSTRLGEFTRRGTVGEEEARCRCRKRHRAPATSILTVESPIRPNYHSHRPRTPAPRRPTSLESRLRPHLRIQVMKISHPERGGNGVQHLRGERNGLPFVSVEKYGSEMRPRSHLPCPGFKQPVCTKASLQCDLGFCTPEIFLTVQRRGPFGGCRGAKGLLR